MYLIQPDRGGSTDQTPLFDNRNSDLQSIVLLMTCRPGQIGRRFFWFQHHAVLPPGPVMIMSLDALMSPTDSRVPTHKEV